MNTQEKFGLKKTHAIMLFVQMLFIILGTVCSIVLLAYMIQHNVTGLMLVSSITILLAYGAIILNATYGFKHNIIFYLCAIGLFDLAVLVNIIVPFRTTAQIILLTLLFGSCILYSAKLDDKKVSLIVAICSSLIALIFSILSAATANPNALGPTETTSLFTVFSMYVSIFTPSIVSITFLAINIARNYKA